MFVLNRRQSRGFTLPEVLVSVTITSLIFGVIVTVFIVSMRVWRRASSFSQAFPPAYQVVMRLNRELKNACHVEILQEGKAIYFIIPQTDANGINVIPLEIGREIMYYRADELGIFGTEGNTLWRQEGEEKPQRIADNVIACTFDKTDLANGRDLEISTSTVTIVGQEQSTRHESEFNTSLTIRNEDPFPEKFPKE